MKNVLFLLLLLPVLTFAQKQVINDPNAEPRSLNGSFHSIEVSHAIDLYLSQGTEEGVAISATDVEVRNHIKTSVVNGVLKIYLEGEGKWWKNAGNKKMRAYVSFQKLLKLKASGASDVYATGAIKVQELDIELSGASDGKFGTIAADKLRIRLSGASDMTVNGGKVGDLTINASGASDFKGIDLATETWSADASGASDIHVTVNSSLSAKASGASSVYYRGGGSVKEMKSSGASTISRK